jgi:hypothetical protein
VPALRTRSAACRDNPPDAVGKPASCLIDSFVEDSLHRSRTSLWRKITRKSLADNLNRLSRPTERHEAGRKPKELTAMLKFLAVAGTALVLLAGQASAFTNKVDTLPDYVNLECSPYSSTERGTDRDRAYKVNVTIAMSNNTISEYNVSCTLRSGKVWIARTNISSQKCTGHRTDLGGSGPAIEGRSPWLVRLGRTIPVGGTANEFLIDHWAVDASTLGRSCVTMSMPGWTRKWQPARRSVSLKPPGPVKRITMERDALLTIKTKEN